MTSFAVKMMAGSPPPVTDSIGSNAKAPSAPSVKRSILPFQLRIKELQRIETSEKKSMNMSRRDLTLCLTAASFSAVMLSSPAPAEARISKAEMKKMILEKLKILREKVGLSEPETEGNEKTAASPSPPTAGKESSPPATSAPSIEEEKIGVPLIPPLPSIQNDKKIVVEAATLP